MTIGNKWLPASRLTELLAEIPGDSRVMVNSVGNLLVLSADGAEAVAYIDFFGDGAVERLVRVDLVKG